MAKSPAETPARQIALASCDPSSLRSLRSGRTRKIQFAYPFSAVLTSITPEGLNLQTIDSVRRVLAEQNFVT